MASTDSPAGVFSPQSSRTSLAEACRIVSVDGSDAVLIRLGENAIFHIPQEGLVIRIARGMDVFDDARKEVAVARWLQTTDVCAAELANYDQPIIADGRPVTFWRYINSSGQEATTSELGAVLRALHALTPPSAVGLPELDFFDRVDVRIDRATEIPDKDREFLRRRVEELRAAYADLVFPLPECAVHGDAHTANLIKTADGSAILIDFERFAFGHPEIDLAVTAVERDIGWYSDSDYAAFVEAYGFDVTEWSGYSVIRDISELKMATWLMQNAGHGDDVAAEVRVRLDSLRNGGAPRRWKPF